MIVPPEQRNTLVTVERLVTKEVAGLAAPVQSFEPTWQKYMKRTRRGLGGEDPQSGVSTETHLFEGLDGGEAIDTTARLSVGAEHFAVTSVERPGDGSLILFARQDQKQ